MENEYEKLKLEKFEIFQEFCEIKSNLASEVNK
jgi:hypothetical protein